MAQSRAPSVLFSATDWIISERFDIVSVLEKFNCATIPISAVAGLEDFVLPGGYMLGLVGIPVVGEPGFSISLTTSEELPIVLLLTLKLLTVDEAQYALQNASENAMELISKFISRGDRLLSWLDRPSVLQEPRLH